MFVEIVAKNGISLVDYANTPLARGRCRAASSEGLQSGTWKFLSHPRCFYMQIGRAIMPRISLGAYWFCALLEPL